MIVTSNYISSIYSHLYLHGGGNVRIITVKYSLGFRHYILISFVFIMIIIYIYILHVALNIEGTHNDQ